MKIEAPASKTINPLFRKGRVEPIWFLFAAILVAFCLFACPAIAQADGYTVILRTESSGRFQGTVGFDSKLGYDGAEEVASQVVGSGMVTVCAFPADGYEFYMWTCSTSSLVCVSQDATFTFSVEELCDKYGSASRLGLYAVFKEKGSSLCLVTLHSEKRKYGEYSGPYFVEKGSEFILPENPFSSDYPEKSPHYIDTSFLGWDVGRPGESITVTSDMTIEAVWSDGNTANVSFAPNGGIGFMELLYVEPGSTFVLPECRYLRTDKVFVGWNLGQPGDTITIEGSTVIEAQWADPEEGNAYRLEYRANIVDDKKTINGATVSEHSFWAYEGQPISLAVASYDGLTFQKASVSGVAVTTRKAFGGWGCSFYMPAKDVSVQVQDKWRYVRISFDPNGGTGEMKVQHAEKQSTYVLPECAFVPPQGKVFDRWALMELTKEEALSQVTQNNIGDGKPGTKVVLDTGMDLVALWKDGSDYKPEPDKPETHTHDLVAVKAADPTCDVPGHETYWKCSGCGKLFADANGTQEISAPKEIPALGHDWGEWTVTKEPTATQEGEKIRTCRRDSSHTETASIPAEGGEPSPYAVIDAGGTAPTWRPESAEGLTFTVKRAEDDDVTYTHFTGVAVDGVSVPPLGYTAEEGSLTLTLLPAYLEGLGEGGHDVSILFDDGIVTASFSIAGPGGVTPTPDPGRSGLPVWAWILIGLAGAAAVAFGVFVLLGRSKTAGRANPCGAVHRRR